MKIWDERVVQHPWYLFREKRREKCCAFEEIELEMIAFLDRMWL